MTIYRGIIGNAAYYARATCLRQAAARLTLAFDTQPSLVEEVGPDYKVSVGNPEAYDIACNSMGHAIPKLVRKAASEEQLADVLAAIALA